MFSRIFTRERLIRLLSVVVVTAGAGVLALTVIGPWPQQVTRAPIQFGLLSALVFLGELNPVALMRRGNKDEISPSTTFAFAILLSMGAGPAVATLAAAGLVADLRERRGKGRIGINMAHATLSLAAAGAVLSAFGDPRPMADLHIGVTDVVPLALATMAFFFVNNVFTAASVAIAQEIPIIRQLVEQLRFEASTTGVLLGLSPVAVLVAQDSPLLLPFLLLPAAAVYTSAKNAMEKEQQSLHDALTGLPNRAFFRREVKRAIENGIAGDGQLAVMLMDLDRFKEVNDTLGHHTGDQLLIQVGPRLTDPAIGLMTVARLGGDEFALLCRAPNRMAAAEIAKRIVGVVQEPFLVEDMKLDLEASIGIAMYPNDGDEV
ncbi:MAG: hypothetical protein QOG64_3018, partial [Acidimicrobiaceae bacterium]|nr:hypothetical protein [Acidimicrobiaceae bacterium]